MLTAAYSNVELEIVQLLCTKFREGLEDMSKEVAFKNRDRFIQLGVAIAALRKIRGLSQEKLAEKAGISRSLVSAIEAPGIANGFSLEVFFDIADALDVDPADLINASVFPDQVIKKIK